MSDWIPYDQWPDCSRLARPGYVFEVESPTGQRLFTPCSVPLQLPFDWTAAPRRFRLVKEPPPRRSNPMPGRNLPRP